MKTSLMEGRKAASAAGAGGCSGGGGDGQEKMDARRAGINKRVSSEPPQPKMDLLHLINEINNNEFDV